MDFNEPGLLRSAVFFFAGLGFGTAVAFVLRLMEVV